MKPNDSSSKSDRRQVSTGLAPTIYESIRRSSDAYDMLSNVIQTAMNDPVQMRRLVYDIAWTMFIRDAEQRTPPLSPSELVAGARALEAAITRIEADHPDGELPDFSSRQVVQISDTPGSPVTIIYPETKPRPARKLIPATPHNDESAWDSYVENLERPVPVLKPRRIWLHYFAWPLLQIATVPVLALALGITVTSYRGTDAQWRQFFTSLLPQASPPNPPAVSKKIESEPKPESKPKIEERVAPIKPQVPSLPLPTAFGVYAISDGKLFELEQLPIKVPDPRIRLSAEISKPSKTILPTGNLAFIVFQRELVNRAPDKVSIRVVAEVTREVKFEDGKAIVTKVGGKWRIRNNSFEYRVAPMNENREMIVVRPDSGDFTFPAGRYALVFNGAGYDFSVGGPTTDAAQCIESSKTINGTIFAECRKP